MFTILTCVTEQHDLTLVGLAGLICFLASHCALVLLDRATCPRARFGGCGW
jgi:NO-binding membrane sensor protein with MHYT domain